MSYSLSSVRFCTLKINRLVLFFSEQTRYNNARLCLIILTCIAEDQYANSLMHDINMNFRVPLHRIVSYYIVIVYMPSFKWYKINYCLSNFIDGGLQSLLYTFSDFIEMSLIRFTMTLLLIIVVMANIKVMIHQERCTESFIEFNDTIQSVCYSSF